jgi:hypothetical protein
MPSKKAAVSLAYDAASRSSAPTALSTVAESASALALMYLVVTSARNATPLRTGPSGASAFDRDSMAVTGSM